MGRRGCCSKEGVNRGAWTAQEDKILTDYIKLHGDGKWRTLPKKAGLKRCGKSCRLRWLNYLRPDIKRGNISPDEDDLIIRLHKLLGNRWSLIAGRLPGRTDNEIKNYWNTHLGKKVQEAPTNKLSNQKKPSQTESSHVVEYCSKSMVFIDPQLAKVEANINNSDADASIEKPVEFNPHINAMSTSIANGENNIMSSVSMMDFNVGHQLCLPDIVNFNFSEEMLEDWTLIGDCVQPNVPSNLHYFPHFLIPEDN